MELKNEDRQWVDTVWDKIDKKLQWVAPQIRGKIPYTTSAKWHNRTTEGTYCDMRKLDVTWWTNGFWPGLMWLMYVGTKNELYRAAAEDTEEILDEAFADYDHLHHDVGFMWHITSGVNYRLFGGHKSKVRTSIAADILASRYNCEGKYIRAWNEDKVGWVIIDCMMNINLLYWASEEYDDPRFKYIAMNHADTVMRTHIREDGSSNHIVRLDPTNGDVIESYGGQGYANGSSWSRGQSWAIYGYALSYIHTEKQEYLDTAKKVADYFIDCVKSDWLPRVDFRAPEEPVYYDSTAGAIASCGFIELAKITGDTKYLDAALNILKAMEKNFCDWSEDNQAILLMGTERYDDDAGRHISIIYGDYFFTEAIYKLKGFDMLFW